MFLPYNGCVTSKNGVIGLGGPNDPAARIAATDEDAAFLSPRILRFRQSGWGSRKTRRPTASAGSPVRQPCLGLPPRLAARCRSASMTHLEAIMANAITPTSTTTCGCGTVLTFEASDAELLASGIAEPEELPAEKRSSKVWFDRKRRGVGSYRMPDGRVRFSIAASLARQRDDAFVGFLGKLMAPVWAGVRNA